MLVPLPRPLGRDVYSGSRRSVLSYTAASVAIVADEVMREQATAAKWIPPRQYQYRIPMVDIFE